MYHAYTCKVTPASRRSCTRSTVAKISFVSLSKIRIFQTGGSAEDVSDEAGFNVSEEASKERRERMAFV